jgi:hypothetical protein
VRGSTTDGSNLYPVPLAELFPGIPPRSANARYSRSCPEPSCAPWPRSARS